jgi:hypothetical protein
MSLHQLFKFVYIKTNKTIIEIQKTNMIKEKQYFGLVNLQALVYCQLYIFSADDKELLNPIMFGSGFFVTYKNNLF